MSVCGADEIVMDWREDGWKGEADSGSDRGDKRSLFKTTKSLARRKHRRLTLLKFIVRVAENSERAPEFSGDQFCTTQTNCKGVSGAEIKFSGQPIRTGCWGHEIKRHHVTRARFDETLHPLNQ